MKSRIKPSLAICSLDFKPKKIRLFHGFLLDQSIISIAVPIKNPNSSVWFRPPMRSVPSLVDGFKPSQRKVLFCAFKKRLCHGENGGLWKWLVEMVEIVYVFGGV